MLVFSHLRWHFIRAASPAPAHPRGAIPACLFLGGAVDSMTPLDPDSLGTRRRVRSSSFLGVEETPGVTTMSFEPHFNHGEDSLGGQRRLLDRFLSDRCLDHFDSWFYTPMALSFASAPESPRDGLRLYGRTFSAFLGRALESLSSERRNSFASRMSSSLVAIPSTTRSVRSTPMCMPSRARSISRISHRRGRVSRTRPTRRAFPIRALASSVCWTSALTSGFCVSEVAVSAAPCTVFVVSFVDQLVKIDPAPSFQRRTSTI